MKRFFLSPNIVLGIVFLNIYFLMYSSFGKFILVIMASFLVLHLARRKKFIEQDTVKKTGTVCLSPVNATVVKIKKGKVIDGKSTTVITTVMGITNEWGLHLPASCQLDKVEEVDGPKVFRFGILPKKGEWSKYKNMKLFFQTKEKIEIAIKIYSCKLGLNTQIFLSPGDRGIAGACFGFVPFGAIAQVFIHEPNTLFIEEGELLLASETVMANLE